MYRILFAACILLLSACSKNSRSGPDEPQQPQGPPLSTPRGAPIGPIATATIGTQGGQLANANGSVKIIVPAGALTASQTFSIQNVENILRPGKPASRSFRLLPENITFSKPVTVVIKYDPADITTGLEEVMRLAYQTPQGQWKATNAALDKNAHTLTATVTHFCDFTFYEQFELFADKDVTTAGQKVQFKVGVMEDDPTIDNLLAPLRAMITKEFDRGSEVSYEEISGLHIDRDITWKVVSGGGTITPKINGYSYRADAEYTAPAQITQAQDVIVEVSLKGTKPIPDASAPGGKRELGQLIIRKTIRLLPAAYCVATLNGQEYALEDGLRATAYSGLTALAAVSNAHVMSVSISFGAMSAGTFHPGKIEPGGGGAVVSFSFKLPNGVTVLGQTAYCELRNNETVQKFSNGVLQISRYAAPGEYIEGEWQGDVYHEKPETHGCQYEPKSLSVRFRIKREA